MYLGSYPPYAHQAGQYGLAMQTEISPEEIMSKLKID